MKGDAAVWARPHLEIIANDQIVFNGDWDTFIAAFKAKFKPINKQSDARLQLQKVKQSPSQKFSEYYANFNTWAGRTGYGTPELYDKCKLGLNGQYLERLTYFVPAPTNLGMLETYCKQTDANLSNLANSKLRQTGTGSSSTHIPGGNNGFSDTTDIDAAKIDKQFVGIKDRDGIWKQFQKVMKDRCRVCGSQNHKTSNNKHTNTKCNYCESDGHWSAVCVRRLQGISAGPVTKGKDCASIRSSNTSSGTSSDYEAKNAALKDRLDVQQKQMKALASKLQLAGF